jgi:copper chaperone CopZ
MFNNALRNVFSAALLLVLAPAAGAAGLVTVDQSVFGMDCAPCAYGVERGLKKLPGVESVRVSLNEGRSVIQFKPDAAVNLEQIRKIIRDNGFTPKAATLTVAGTLAQSGKEWFLDAGAAGRYRLDPSLVGKAASGQTVTLQGEAPEGVTDRLAAPAPQARS